MGKNDVTVFDFGAVKDKHRKDMYAKKKPAERKKVTEDTTPKTAKAAREKAKVDRAAEKKEKAEQQREERIAALAEMDRINAETGDDETIELKSGRRLTFRAWLWLQQTQGTSFAPLSRLILSGGPNQMWANRGLYPEKIEYEIAQMVASRQPGVRGEHLKLARRAIHAFKKSTDTVESLIEEQEKVRSTPTRRQLDSYERGAAGAAVSTHNYEDSDDQRLLPSRGEGGLRRFMCDYVNKKGEQCDRSAVLGTTRCDWHGSQYMTKQELQEIVRKGYELIISASSAAVDTTLDIMQNSVDDKTRLKAAEMILNRSGLRPGVDVNITEQDVGGVADPAQEILKRLEALSDRGEDLKQHDGQTITPEGEDVQ